MSSAGLASVTSRISRKKGVFVRTIVNLGAFCALALAGGGIAWLSGSAPLAAADHFDPPSRTDATATATPDIGADIADIYLYHTATSLIVSIGFAGPQNANNPAVYDRDVDFNIFLSNAGSTADAEYTINLRFGQDPAVPNSNGIRITGIPGTTGPIVAPVETIVSTQGVRVFAGLIDDPFNFDATGFRLTRETGTLMIDKNRNRFFGLNTTAVVIEIPLTSIRNGNNPISAWCTSARITQL
jgi:hypothetical protein